MKEFWINFGIQSAMTVLAGLISNASPTSEVTIAATKALQDLEDLIRALSAAKAEGKL